MFMPAIITTSDRCVWRNTITIGISPKFFELMERSNDSMTLPGKSVEVEMTPRVTMVVVAGMLSACSTSGYVNDDYPKPGSQASQEALNACREKVDSKDLALAEGKWVFFAKPTQTILPFADGLFFSPSQHCSPGWIKARHRVRPVISTCMWNEGWRWRR